MILKIANKVNFTIKFCFCTPCVKMYTINYQKNIFVLAFSFNFCHELERQPAKQREQ